MAWEVDWAHQTNTGQAVLARNPASYQVRTRKWHMVSTGYLRQCGVNTPTYRKDSWEVDWTKRNGKKVWARNLSSKMPSARAWHWIGHDQLDRSGLLWRPKTEHSGRYIDSRGYVVLTRKGMTVEDVKLSKEHDLFRGERKTFVKEHRLAAVKKYGGIPRRSVVRHLNGIKHDNRPENLLLGTTQENTMDHNTARLQAISWREKYEKAQLEIESLRATIKTIRAALGL